MKTPPKNTNREINEEQLVEEYFAAIWERQQIEKEYYQTRDPELLVKLKTAKERIIQVTLTNLLLYIFQNQTTDLSILKASCCWMKGQE